MYEVAEKRILVVEDDASIRQVLCFFLTHSGFETRCVADGKEAILIIPEYAPHLIILDLLMRPVSGWDVLHWLSANRFLPTTPVLVLSALVQLDEQVHGFEEGAIEYLTKPTQPSIIVERVRTILSLDKEQRLMLQHKRMDEKRKVLDRLCEPQADEFVY